MFYGGIFAFNILSGKAVTTTGQCITVKCRSGVGLDICFLIVAPLWNTTNGKRKQPKWYLIIFL